jgi:diguanylate cyclase (GGDEF)-like protein
VIPGMLSADQFSALLSRDLAIARRHDRSVTLILFEIMEFDIYRDTFGVLTAEACARMIATQILGTFGRKIDLRARLDPTTFAVAVHEQPEAPADSLAQTVAEKTLRLSLPNPRGQRRHIEVASVCIEAQAGKDDAASLISRARQSLSGDRSDLPRHTLRSAG